MLSAMLFMGTLAAVMLPMFMNEGRFLPVRLRLGVAMGMGVGA